MCMNGIRSSCPGGLPSSHGWRLSTTQAWPSRARYLAVPVIMMWMYCSLQLCTRYELE